VRELVGHVGAREHVRLHPPAVGAGVAGEVDEDETIRSRSRSERFPMIVENPLQIRRILSGDEHRNVGWRKERFDLAE
jgi:hypothetical protein